VDEEVIPPWRQTFDYSKYIPEPPQAILISEMGMFTAESDDPMTAMRQIFAAYDKIRGW
jgi:hypothetical protein